MLRTLLIVINGYYDPFIYTLSIITAIYITYCIHIGITLTFDHIMLLKKNGIIGVRGGAGELLNALKCTLYIQYVCVRARHSGVKTYNIIDKTYEKQNCSYDEEFNPL